MHFMPAKHPSAGAFAYVTPLKHQGKDDVVPVTVSPVSGCLVFIFQRHKYICKVPGELFDGKPYEVSSQAATLEPRCNRLHHHCHFGVLTCAEKCRATSAPFQVMRFRRLCIKRRWLLTGVGVLSPVRCRVARSASSIWTVLTICTSSTI